MRIMITGSRGQVGQSLRRALPEHWELIATDSKTLDITQADTVEAMISNFQPDVLVNAAGYTNVDRAEDEPQKAFLINAQGVANLASAAQRHGVRMIHFSSDYVFDGNKNKPYEEGDSPSPLNVYGRSKLAGELLALSNASTALIVRTSGVFSEFGHNFVHDVVHKLQAGQKMMVVDDQISCPTYAGDLADMIITLIQDYPAERGIVHYCSQEAVSWYDFACQIAQLAGLDTDLIEAVSSVRQSVRRPAYSALSGKQTASFHRVPMTLERALQQCIGNLEG